MKKNEKKNPLKKLVKTKNNAFIEINKNCDSTYNNSCIFSVKNQTYAHVTIIQTQY